MAEFKISRFRYTWKGDWTDGATYVRDDVVGYSGSSYVCMAGHTAAADFYTDSENWRTMTQGTSWRGDWSNSTPYNLGDVVSYRGATYVCAAPHTASSTFAANSSNWTAYQLGTAWSTDWESNHRYGVGDVVVFHGIVYRCITEHTSALNDKLENQTLNWEVYYQGSEYLTDWADEQIYRYNDLVKFGGSIYRCNTSHTAYTDFNALYWDIDLYGYQFGNDWDATALYQLGDIVRYGGDLFYSTVMNNDTAPETDPTVWIKLSKGYNIRGDWAVTEAYRPGDVVRRGGNLYLSLVGSETDYSSLDYMDTSNWELLIPGSKWRGAWTNITSSVSERNLYIHNTVVLGDIDYVTFTLGDFAISELFLTKYVSEDARGYVALQEGPAWTAPQDVYTPAILAGGHFGPNGTIQVGDNMLDGLVLQANTTYTMWIQQTGLALTEYIFSTDVNYVSNTIPADYSEYPGNPTQLQIVSNFEITSNTYAVGDVVIYAGGTYRCTESHVSDDWNYPSTNSIAVGLWEIHAAPGDYTSMRIYGDLSMFGPTLSPAGDGSSIGPTRVPIGNEDELLMIDDTDGLYYTKFGEHQQLRYVAPNGVDRVDYGLSPYTPWKTIRYATEQMESIGGKTKLMVRAGRYFEVLPIIVPEGLTLVGEEVRGVTVLPKPANANLASDADFTIEVLDRILTIKDALLAGSVIVVTNGNTTPQDRTVTGSSSAALVLDSIIADTIAYIDFHINGNGTDPTVSGNNTARTQVGYVNAVVCLTNNTEFLAAEAVAFMIDHHPEYAFDSESCKRDVRAFINAWKYDLIYPGNYKSLLAGRYYRNAVLGSEGEDMFYLRDATGVRNMTLSGLTGILGPTGTYELLQRVNGPTYCSLDPGWGPDDNRTWINTRSPYIQNCATFGNAVTGQKIDGALHNGGNKSFVSNDFTQLINDGVGAHVLNGGRAELVSVFTYYSHVGYFAENGGIIRATNGNNSYGTYGALAIGVDDTEVPRIARVNTRLEQAAVADAFAGEVAGSADRLLILEYSNAGQNYTNATFSLVGAGANADVRFEETRDGGVFESLILDPEDSSIYAGGGGYTYVVNNAQQGDDTTIKLAASDPNIESSYLGMRVIITSGVGCGQYGYIHAYSAVTKIAQIYRESDGLPGWDHVVPGTPAASLSSSSRYSIEPRPVFSDPDYSSASVSLSSSQQWENVVFGETRNSWSDVPGAVGSGTLDETVILTTATWDIIKTGRTYSVTINDHGSGYSVGQRFTISGELLGGQTPDNNITITVTGVSNDSTNSITGFTYFGTATSGVYVATANSGTAGSYSYNGTTWTAMTMPATGNWNCLAAGNNMFVALQAGTTNAAYSYNGINWTLVSLPVVGNWTNVSYGNGKFVAVASNLNRTVYSSNGISWTSNTMVVFGDSTYNEWQDLAYGQSQFVAIANSGNVAATSSDGITWVGQNLDAHSDSTQEDWTSVAYGNGRWVAISSQGSAGYSLDGILWQSSMLPKQDGSTVMHWNRIRYGQGVFLATCDTVGITTVGSDPANGTTTYIATSYDGISWTGRELSDSKKWKAAAFGNPDVIAGDSSVANNNGNWILISGDASNSVANIVSTGARALGRVNVVSGRITVVKLWEPGSGYHTAPTLTIVDPSNTSDLYTEQRLGDGVLAQPYFANRGIGYRTSSTVVTVSGNGFADILPVGKYIVVSGMSEYPKTGAQLTFEGNSTIFTVVTEEKLGDLEGTGTLTARFQVSPNLTVQDHFNHDTRVEIREKFSQCRITGHDFLDVGTGNVLETLYPALYSRDYYKSPEQEVAEVEGGRVFYTSTDQSGNFRTGELFAVEQATGIVTISADFFNFNGLTELRLGGVRLGGSGVVVYEFSTDPLFTADSNNIVPTQRAIKTYLANKLSVAGADLVTSEVATGQVALGGINNSFSMPLGGTIYVLPRVDFEGAKVHSRGMMQAMSMFYSSFKQDGQL